MSEFCMTFVSKVFLYSVLVRELPMETLLDNTKPLAGPHAFVQMKKDNVVGFFMGEEHSNKNMCHKDGADVGDVIKQAVIEGANVYLEMPISYEESLVNHLKCMPKPEFGPRKDVLNSMRTCLLAYRNGNKQLRDKINFTDVRESFNLLPYTAREDACVKEVKDNIRNKDFAEVKMKKHFVDPLFNCVQNIKVPDEEFRRLILDTDRPVTQDWEKFVVEQWIKRCHGKLDKTLDAFYQFEKIHMKSVAQRQSSLDKVVDPYRGTLDACTDVYTVYRILKDIHENGVNVVICYAGSSHTIAICDILKEFDFEENIQTRTMCGHHVFDSSSCIYKAKLAFTKLNFSLVQLQPVVTSMSLFLTR
jgi:hypothetical protein